MRLLRYHHGKPIVMRRLELDNAFGKRRKFVDDSTPEMIFAANFQALFSSLCTVMVLYDSSSASSFSNRRVIYAGCSHLSSI